jgi:hypothetical protein
MEGAKLLGSIVAGGSSRKWEQSLRPFLPESTPSRDSANRLQLNFIARTPGCISHASGVPKKGDGEPQKQLW